MLTGTHEEALVHHQRMGRYCVALALLAAVLFVLGAPVGWLLPFALVLAWWGGVPGRATGRPATTGRGRCASLPAARRPARQP